MIKSIFLAVAIMLTAQIYAQDASIVKLEVPTIDLAENQNFEVLSYEVTGPDQYSILYMQDLPATVVGSNEFWDPKMLGAFQKQTKTRLEDFVPYSNKAIFLVRQSFNSKGEGTTNFWVIAVREMESTQEYTMHYPEGFVHPIIANNIPIEHSLKNVDQVPNLTEREFSSLVSMAKKRYGFYTYPTPSYKSTASTLADDIRLMKSGFKDLKAALGGGNSSLPKGETVLFKREVVDNIRLAATRVTEKNTTTFKLYISMSNESEYELLDSQDYEGKANPLYASALAYDAGLDVAGAYGWVVLKYKDENGSQSRVVVLGIDQEGEPHFWKLDVGKNGLNSFTPYFSYSKDEGIYVVSQNRDKIFKPFYQHHLLGADGKVTQFFPENEGEQGSEKSEFIHTEQPPAPAAPAPTSTTALSSTNEPAGIIEFDGHRYIFTCTKTVNNANSVKTTQFGNLSVVHIDEENKVVEHFDIQENKSSELPYPYFLGVYDHKAYYLVDYSNAFILSLSTEKVETEMLESDAYQMLAQSNEDLMTINQYGKMILTKSVVGKKIQMWFYPEG